LPTPPPTQIVPRFWHVSVTDPSLQLVEYVEAEQLQLTYQVQLPIHHGLETGQFVLLVVMLT
jgi:hypothetical protein